MNLKNTIILFFLCLSFCVFGQADSSTVHGLRELTGDAFKTTDHTGFPNKSLEELKKAAQDLKDILPATITGFKVFDYGSYPMLKYMGKINMDSTLFLAMQQEIEKTTQNYLLIGKHIDPRTGEVSFKVKLKLPVTGNKGAKGNMMSSLSDDKIAEVQEDALQLTEAENKRQANQMNNKAELVGIKATKHLLSEKVVAGRKILAEEEDNLSFASGITPNFKAIMTLPYEMLKANEKFVYLCGTDYIIRGFYIYEEDGKNKKLVNAYSWDDTENAYVDIFSDNKKYINLKVTLNETALKAKIWQIDATDGCFLRFQYIPYLCEYWVR